MASAKHFYTCPPSPNAPKNRESRPDVLSVPPSLAVRVFPPVELRGESILLRRLEETVIQRDSQRVRTQVNKKQAAIRRLGLRRGSKPTTYWQGLKESPPDTDCRGLIDRTQ